MPQLHVVGDSPLSPAPPGRLTVSQVITVYLNNCRPGSARAFAERKRVLDIFAADFGQRLLDDCRPVDLLAWINEHSGWKSDWTRLRIVGTVQRPFNWADRLRLIDRNPFRGVPAPAGDAGRAMTAGEFRKLLRSTDAVFRRVLVFLRYTGARPGEMCALAPEQIDWGRGCAVLPQHKTARSRKDRRPRLIVLHPVALRLLAWILRHNQPGRFLFVNARGRPWNRNSLGLRIYRLREKCGLAPDCKLYGLRHAFGTGAALGGLQLATIAELMGHSTTRMTERYIHLAGETAHLQAAVIRAVR